MIKQLLDFISRRTARDIVIDARRARVDEATQPAYSRVLEELQRLEKQMKESRNVFIR